MRALQGRYYKLWHLPLSLSFSRFRDIDAYVCYSSGFTLVLWIPCRKDHDDDLHQQQKQQQRLKRTTSSIPFSSSSSSIHFTRTHAARSEISYTPILTALNCDARSRERANEREREMTMIVVSVVVVVVVVIALLLATTAHANPLNEFRYLPVESRYPEGSDIARTNITRIDVEVDPRGLVPSSWNMNGLRWTMSVLLPSRVAGRGERAFRRELPARLPIALMLHPTQVFEIDDEDNDYFQSALWLAKQGMIGVVSLEAAGQFGGGGTATAELLTKRAIAMVRTIYKLGETDANSPLTGRVARSFCAYGYSLGGGSVQGLPRFTEPEDGLRCIVPMHSPVAPTEYSRFVNVPVLAATGQRDRDFPSRRMWSQYAGSGGPPIALVEIGGEGVRSFHIDNDCGNECPALRYCCSGPSQTRKHMSWIAAFMALYLLDRTDLAPVFWHSQNTSIARLGGVSRISKAPKTQIALLGATSPVDDDDDDENDDVPSVRIPYGIKPSAVGYEEYVERLREEQRQRDRQQEQADAARAGGVGVSAQTVLPQEVTENVTRVSAARVTNRRRGRQRYNLRVLGDVSGSDTRCSTLRVRGVSAIIDGGATKTLKLDVEAPSTTPRNIVSGRTSVCTINNVVAVTDGGRTMSDPVTFDISVSF